MNHINKRITLDLYSPTTYEIVYAKQGDRASRIFELELLYNGQPYDITAYTLFTIGGKRADGVDVLAEIPQENIDYQNNIITMELPETFMYAEGTADFEVQMYDDSSALSAVAPFKVRVYKKFLDVNVATKDENFKLFIDALNRLAAIEQNEEQRQLNEKERALNEDKRQNAEAIRQTNEWQRQQNEEVRLINEEDRKINELERQENEDIRQEINGELRDLLDDCELYNFATIADIDDIIAETYNPDEDVLSGHNVATEDDIDSIISGGYVPTDDDIADSNDIDKIIAKLFYEEMKHGF